MTMIQREVMKKLISFHRNLIPIRNSSSNLNIENLEKESSIVEVVEEEDQAKEEELERKRNKSRLRSQHRNIVHDENPYPEPVLPHHETIGYLRRNYGRYGEASGVNPSICWPVRAELDEAMEYERVKYPYSIMEMVAAAKERRREKEERILARQEDIIKKMEKLEAWKQDFYNRIAKKENEAKAAKDRKDRLIEEVKRHFGYTVDPRDDRFKELLEKKEKEQKKAMKEERRKAKEAKMVDKLLKKKNVNQSDEVGQETEKQVS